MSILVNRCVRRSFLVKELVESWQVHHKAAMYALDVEALVGECLDLSTLLRESWQKLRDLLFDEQICDIDGAGKLLEGCATRAIPMFERVLGFVPNVEKTGHLIARAGELGCALKEMTILKETIEKEWPKIDLKMTEESLDDYRRGEYNIAEALLNDVKSCSS